MGARYFRYYVYSLAIIVILTCLNATAVAATSADANFGLGKMEIRSQAIGQSLRLTLPMLVPGDISKGWRTYLGSTWCNIWSNDEEYLLDYELLDTFLGIGYGFDNHWGLALILDDRTYFGGAMDGFIENFHDTLDIDQDGRDKADHNDSVVSRYDPDTGETLTEISAGELDNTGASVLLNYNVPSGNTIWPSVNLYGLIRYILKAPKVLDGDTKFDYGLGIGLAKQLSERWYAYGVLGYTIYASDDKTSAGQVEFRDHQKTGLFALAWHYRPDFAVMLQMLYTDAAIKTIKALDEASNEIHFGFKWRINENYLVDFALIENIISWDNSPDFGVHLGISIGI